MSYELSSINHILNKLNKPNKLNKRNRGKSWRKKVVLVSGLWDVG